MPLKTFKPNTPSERYKELPSFDEITKSKPEKSLLTPLKRSGGRNNTGRITTRHIGVVTSATTAWSISNATSAMSRQPSSESNTIRTVPAASPFSNTRTESNLTSWHQPG